MGGRTLFENATMTVNYGERVALVGPNGAGKSTLFNIILKKDTPDAGAVERDEWTMVGYLPQESAPVGDETVMDVATGRAGRTRKTAARARASSRCQRPGISGSAREAPGAQRSAGGSESEEDVARAGLRESDFDRKAKEMSGGWVMRAHGAAARDGAGFAPVRTSRRITSTCSRSSGCRLPEDYSGALLLISHDRECMDEVVVCAWRADDRRQ
ncbi:MAG: ABC-F family ATP-binding cassette domain-containing protein, partial [Chthoniobacterales bacterium]|nr:ABC-F family ATP-binding cassette domain-containing protein [Chthoniobacterales bacterium]